MARQLEIVFYGMACFERRSDGSYRVLFPDGRDTRAYSVPEHHASIWVRDRPELATARWPWTARHNDFSIEEPCELQIPGLLKTPLDTRNFDDRLPNLRESDPAFTIASNPEAIVEMTIDRGALSAHQFPTGMILTKWVVEADPSTAIRFYCDGQWIEITPATEQVILACVGAGAHGTGNHFQIYRKLATVKTGPLIPKPPAAAPLRSGLVVRDPNTSYVRTPDGDCSNGFVG